MHNASSRYSSPVTIHLKIDRIVLTALFLNMIYGLLDICSTRHRGTIDRSIFISGICAKQATRAFQATEHSKILKAQL